MTEVEDQLKQQIRKLELENEALHHEVSFAKEQYAWLQLRVIVLDEVAREAIALATLKRPPTP